MKILNISSIIPLPGLKRENDIVLRVQDYLKKKYKFHFVVAKSVPYAPKVLGMFSAKWKIYNKLYNVGKADIQGYTGIIYPWIMPPSSLLWINYILIPINALFFRFKTREKLLDFTDGIDLILAQNNIPDSIVAYYISKATGKPYILNVRGNFSPIILKLPFLSKIYKEASEIITHSPQNFLRLKNKCDIIMIPHPVEDFFFKKSAKEFSKPLRLITVCRLLELKNLDLVISALSAMKMKGYKFKYEIIGDGPEEERLKKLAKELNVEDEINFHGHLEQSKVQQYLENAAIFIMPSFPETLGRAFLEAAAMRCLIVGHKKTGVDGLLIHNESGCFVNKNTLSDELEKIFQGFENRKYDAFVQKAFTITSELTWQKIGLRYFQLYSAQKK